MTKHLGILVFAFGLLFSSSLWAHTPHDVVYTVCVSPDFETDKTVFCSIDYMSKFLVKSTDGGLTWTPSHNGLPYSTVVCMAMSPGFGDDGTLFAGIHHGRIFKTTDRGESWSDSSVGLNGLFISALAVSPEYRVDATLYCASGGGGLFKSTDSGASWTQCNTGLPNETINTIVFSPSYGQDQTLFLGTEEGIYKSTDGAQNWFNPLDSSLSGFNVTALALSPGYAQDQTIFAGVYDWGIFKSTDGGKTWYDRNNGITDFQINAIGLSPDFIQDQVLFVATRTVGVFVSHNSGNLFESLNKGLDRQAVQTDNHYFCFTFSPDFADDHVVFLGAWEGLHRLNSSMTAWRHLDLFGENMIRDLVLSPAFSSDGTLWAAAYGGGIYRSYDGGDSWQAVNTGLKWMYPAALAVSPDYSQDNILFTGIWDDVMKSTVQGDSWYELDPTSEWFYCKAMAISPGYAVDRTLFAGNGEEAVHTIFKTIDGGDTFVALDAGGSLITSLALSPDYPSDQTLFAGSKEGIFRSVDGGLNWNRVFDKYTVLTLAVSPNFTIDGIVFAGTARNGLYLSTDRGGTWISASKQIGNDVIRDIVFSPDFATDQTLFIAGKGSGIFKSVDGGLTWLQSGLIGEFVHCLALSPGYATDRTVYVGGWHGVYRSNDDGITWSQVLNIRYYDEWNNFVRLSGTWLIYHDQFASGGRLSYSKTPMDFSEIYFIGDSIKAVGARAPSGGIAAVYLDGLYMADVDLYSPQPEWQTELFLATGLPPGEHTLRIEVTGTKNPISNGISLFIDAFQVGGL